MQKELIEMEPRIESLAEKKLIGKRMKMTLSNNKTGELWKSFMQRRKEIKNNLTTDFYSMQVYDQSFDFQKFDPYIPFEKWAAVEVSNFDGIPHEMESLIVPGGLYAVFIHKGAAGTAPKTFKYIFGTWLPNSEYLLDNRPHFEILGEKYKNEEPDSEEEVWIPIKPRK
jgi:AraC family transcriptional regulator